MKLYKKSFYVFNKSSRGTNQIYVYLPDNKKKLCIKAFRSYVMINDKNLCFNLFPKLAEELKKLCNKDEVWKFSKNDMKSGTKYSSKNLEQNIPEKMICTEVWFSKVWDKIFQQKPGTKYSRKKWYVLKYDSVKSGTNIPARFMILKASIFQ